MSLNGLEIVHRREVWLSLIGISKSVVWGMGRACARTLFCDRHREPQTVIIKLSNKRFPTENRRSDRKNSFTVSGRNFLTTTYWILMPVECIILTWWQCKDTLRFTLCEYGSWQWHAWWKIKIFIKLKLLSWSNRESYQNMDPIRKSPKSCDPFKLWMMFLRQIMAER